MLYIIHGTFVNNLKTTQDFLCFVNNFHPQSGDFAKKRVKMTKSHGYITQAGQPG
jgi:hypothetical protein